MVFDSFGKGAVLGGMMDKYKPVVLNAAASLATRFSSAVGCTKSWNEGHHCNRDPTVITYFPVIIDNMMNLELLLWAAENEDDPAKTAHYKMIAMSRENPSIVLLSVSTIMRRK